MPDYVRAFRPGGTFFLTLVTQRRAIRRRRQPCAVARGDRTLPVVSPVHHRHHRPVARSSALADDATGGRSGYFGPRGLSQGPFHPTTIYHLHGFFWLVTIETIAPTLFKAIYHVALRMNRVEYPRHPETLRIRSTCISEVTTDCQFEPVTRDLCALNVGVRFFRRFENH